MLVRLFCGEKDLLKIYFYCHREFDRGSRLKIKLSTIIYSVP
jgi:hypothetical protein